MATMFGAPIAALLGLRMHTPEIVGTISGKDMVWPVGVRPAEIRMVVTHVQPDPVIRVATTPDIFAGPTIKWQTSIDGIYWRDLKTLGVVPVPMTVAP